MKVDITSMFFNSIVEGKTATPAWRTSLGQSKSKACRLEVETPGLIDIIVGLTYKAKSDLSKLEKNNISGDLLVCSVFDKIYVNSKLIEGTSYTLLLLKETSASHSGRLQLCYSPHIAYDGYKNSDALTLFQQRLGVTNEGCWFVYDISIKNQDELHFSAVVVDNDKPAIYTGTSQERSNYWRSLVPSLTTSSNYSSEFALQQIFYGAPGTGKSHKVNKEIQNTPNALVFRTTFHPDSDYSTFVGAYKPTMKSADRLYSADELIDKLSEIKTLGHTYPCHKFAAKYWYSLKGLSAADIKRIVVACDFPESMTVEVGKGIAIGEEMAKHVQNDKIVYSFVPQAFLKAYVAAWQNLEQPVFLVIEEINRGNCAQIFGDIFQLLDRKDGVSEYPIKADQDIRDYLAKEFAGYDLEANILSGEELVLPANLHIWATMNTSDQSLFPIDSAFKRRWDWRYMPIHDAGENWTIALSDVEYDWWDFVEKINNVIGNMTSSEDKKLGYFFCKACNGKINAEKFVNKVVFYLWNDVFKDYELSDKAFQDGESKLTFNKFYTPSGDANEATIKTLMENMGVSISDLISEIDEEAVNLSKDDLSALQQKRLVFWTRYLKYAQNNADYMQYFGGRQTPTKNYYCQFHVLQKKGYLCVVIKHKANKLFVKYETMDEQLYNTLYSHKAAIESELGDINLTWEGKVGTRERIDIYAEHNVDFNNEQSIFDLIIDRLLRMREVFDKYLNN